MINNFFVTFNLIKNYNIILLSNLLVIEITYRVNYHIRNLIWYLKSNLKVFDEVKIYVLGHCVKIYAFKNSSWCQISHLILLFNNWMMSTAILLLSFTCGHINSYFYCFFNLSSDSTYCSYLSAFKFLNFQLR